jgi:hypothetical protein
MRGKGKSGIIESVIHKSIPLTGLLKQPVFN